MLELDFLIRQRAFSVKAFGVAPNLKRHIKHLESELVEVTAAPKDILEYADLYIISLDITMRAGYTPEEVYAQYYHVLPSEVSTTNLHRLISALNDNSQLIDYLEIARTVERLAESNRVTTPILRKAIELKLEVNQQRTWPDPSKLKDTEFFHHIDPDSPHL